MNNFYLNKFSTLIFLIFFNLTWTQFQPQTTEEHQTAINLWIDNNSEALTAYGDINNWDVSLIEDMS